MEQEMARMGRMFEEVARPFEREGVSFTRDVKVKYTDELYEVKVPVKDFSPEELSVKVSGNRLTVSAKYESKPDDKGVIYQEFTKQLEIPKDVEVETLESLVTEDGHLVVRGKVKASEKPKERQIKIEKEAAQEAEPLHPNLSSKA